MAAVFAAAGRAPITAVLIVFELTGDYSIILPLMLAVVVATGLSRLLSEDTIYTLKLRRRGIDIDRPPRPGPPTSPGEWSTAPGATNGEMRIASFP
jgi:CIC family chloride channel protein